ncbi:MAG: PINc/VapC family ATPase [Euryarchaeota archaeon]|nr:PINc/VapC family ATPase [Euryarchaeota archaeon]
MPAKKAPLGATAKAKSASAKKTTRPKPKKAVKSEAGGDKSASGKPRHPVVPDTSVIVDGRITMLVHSGDLKGAEVLVPEAVVSELEAQANRGMDAGFNGLDEIVALQRLADEGRIRLRFVGPLPTQDEIDRSGQGAIDALIRDVAGEEDAELITGDKVQAQVAEALGIRYRYLRAADEAQTIEELSVSRYFDDDTMSVHLKQDVRPYAKRGMPGKREIVQVGTSAMTKKDLNRIAREVVEAARRDDRSFVEIEREGATVVQLRNMRIAISRPPFSESIEITAVRPVAFLTIEDYNLPPEVIERLSDHSRGVFVSGPPGSGKSTFAQAVAEYLHTKGTVVKTMESPRDLVLREEITQYAPLERDVELTGDFLLLVRPDFVVYDEVRKTRDFEVFADMRLAGVGLIGVTHANRAIDAVQRLIGRVELGMIPQVVDTVVHIIGGEIQQILEMDFTVRVPSGMTEADLARPVIRVRDFLTKDELFEIYTYGEQVVVMPIQGPQRQTGTARLAEDRLVEMLGRHLQGRYEVEVTGGDRATVYAEEREIPSIIGKGGTNVQALERRMGMKLNIKSLAERPRPGGKRPVRAKEPATPDRPAPSRSRPVETEWAEETRGGGAEIRPFVRGTKRNVVIGVGPEYAGQEVEVRVDGEPVVQGSLNRKGEMRVGRTSPEGKRIHSAGKTGRDVSVTMV